MELHEMLRKMVIERASDLFIKAGSPPALRIDGSVNFLDTDEITPQDTLEVYEIIEDSKREGFRGKTDIDVAYELPGIGRLPAPRNVITTEYLGVSVWFLLAACSVRQWKNRASPGSSCGVTRVAINSRFSGSSGRRNSAASSRPESNCNLCEPGMNDRQPFSGRSAPSASHTLTSSGRGNDQ